MTWWQYMTAVRWNFNRYACGLGTIQSDMPPGPLKIKEKGYSTDVPPSGMPTDTVKLYQERLLLHCRCKIHPCWSSAHYRPCLLVLDSLSAMLFGAVPHYRPCLQVWYLTIGHAFWYGASLSAMPTGVLPHYRPYLLVWCLTISHACWCGSSL